LPQSAVWSVIVVVAFELVQYERGVSSVEDQESVEEFAADRRDEALGDRVRSRCPHRRLDDLDVDGGEDGGEDGGQGGGQGGGELAVAIAEEESVVPVGVVEVHEQVVGQPCARLWSEER